MGTSYLFPYTRWIILKLLNARYSIPLIEKEEISLAGTMEKTMLRVGEAAELLSVSRWTIYRWVEDGRLRGTKLGKGSLRIFRESVTGLITRNKTATAGAPTSLKRP